MGFLLLNRADELDGTHGGWDRNHPQLLLLGPGLFKKGGSFSLEYMEVPIKMTGDGRG